MKPFSASVLSADFTHKLESEETDRGRKGAQKSAKRRDLVLPTMKAVWRKRVNKWTHPKAETEEYDGENMIVICLLMTMTAKQFSGLVQDAIQPQNFYNKAKVPQSALPSNVIPLVGHRSLHCDAANFQQITFWFLCWLRSSQIFDRLEQLQCQKGTCPAIKSYKNNILLGQKSVHTPSLARPAARVPFGETDSSRAKLLDEKILSIRPGNQFHNLNSGAQQAEIQK